MNLRYLHIGLLLSVFFQLGCASNVSNTQPTEQNHSSDEALTQGLKTTIETSQGTIEIEPTVVDMEKLDESEPLVSQQPASIYYDPFEPVNRVIFKFNHYAYRYALTPLSKGYKAVVPMEVRSSVDNAFENVREPLNLINNLASGEIERAGTNLGRFLINTTVGIFGLFDPASAWFDIKPAKQTISDALREYNVGNGAYLVIPLLGQSDMRAAVSLVGESFIHPITISTDSPETYYIRGVDSFQSFSQQETLYNTLYDQAEDPYLFFRNQYLQGVERDAQFQPE